MDGYIPWPERYPYGLRKTTTSIQKNASGVELFATYPASASRVGESSFRGHFRGRIEHMTRLVLISDTHTHHDFTIPEGDILVHSGDLTYNGKVHEVAREATWLKGIKTSHQFKDIVVIDGNHDWLGERDPGLMRSLIEEAGCIYLDHQAKEIQGLKFFGSGYTPEFCNWSKNVERGPALARLWAQIPDDTQILVTHGPSKGRLDRVKEPDESDYHGIYGMSIRYKEVQVGCADLRNRISELKDLIVHTYGHIHVWGGQTEKGADGITYCNASVCNERYEPNNSPIVLDIEGKTVTVVK